MPDSPEEERQTNTSDVLAMLRDLAGLGREADGPAPTTDELKRRWRVRSERRAAEEGPRN